MKRVLLFTMIMVLAVAGVFAANSGKNVPLSDSAKVKLDLDVEKFVVGFTFTESRAKLFTAYTGDYEMTSSYSTNEAKAEVTTAQSTAMYFFYDCAMKRDHNFKLTAEIVRPLTQQNDTDTGNATGTPDTIQYTATVTGGISNDDFKDGTWVTAANTLVTLDSENGDTKKTGTVVANLRGNATAPYTVVYASAMKIALAVKDGQHLEAKKSAVYRSEIKFTVETAS